METKAPSRYEIDGRLALAVVALTAVATTLMLEATRVFLSYTVFVVDQSKRVELAAIAVAIFLAYGLSAVVVKMLGARSAIVVAAGALIVARLVLQFWDEPVARIVLGAVATVCWGWLLAVVIGVARDPAALGVGIGLVADFSIRLAFLTVDLPWMPDAARDVVTLALVVVAVLLVYWFWKRDVPAATEPTGPKVISLFAIGPALAVYHLALGNLGFLVEKSERELPIVGLWTLFGALAALGEIWRVRTPGSSERREVIDLILISVMPAIGLWLTWRGIGPGTVWAPLATFGAIALVLRALEAGGTRSTREGVSGTAVWITIGMVIQTALVFAYFTFSGHPVPLALAVLLLVAGAWLGGPVRPALPRWAPPRARLAPIAVPAIVAVVAGIALLRYDEADAGPSLGGEITVMTYNIQLGFSRDNYWSLEETARTIEAEDPDVVILQEVSRGWVIASGVDQVQWLSQRLDMPVAFGGVSHDGLWGNAILTRAPILSESETSFTTTVNLRRGMVAVQVATQAGELWVFATHLDNPDDAGEVRMQQVQELLETWNGRTPAILAGDFNATPDSDVLAALTQAGFVDTGASLGPDAFTSEDGRRIDYVMVAGPITTREVRIPDVWTSDHKPVVAEVTVGV